MDSIGNRMKNILILLGIFICINTTAFANNWNKQEKILFGTKAIVLSIDYLQTNYCISSNAHHEKNPIINAGVDAIGNDFIPIYFGTSLFVVWSITNNLSHNNRKIFLATMIILSIGCTTHNKRMGIGFNK